MRTIEPGEEFEIEYGNGHRLKVVGLSFRQERELAKAEDAAKKVSTNEEAFDICEHALRLSLTNHDDKQFSVLLDKLNLNLIQEILLKINTAAEVSTDDEKKSE